MCLVVEFVGWGVVFDLECDACVAECEAESDFGCFARGGKMGTGDRADLLTSWLELYRDWFQENVLTCRWTEQRVVSNQFGYAGTADLLIEHKVHGLCIVDLKTMKINPTPPLDNFSSCFVAPPKTAKNRIFHTTRVVDERPSPH